MEKLPNEMLFYILSFGDHPSFVLHFSQVNKRYREIITEGTSIWKILCKMWITYIGKEKDINFSLYQDIAPKTEKASNWMKFMKKIYFDRRIKLENTRSVYNEKYHCTLNQISFAKRKKSTYILLHIDERGDYSLGSLQNPMSSQLVISSIKKEMNLYPKTSNFSVSDKKKQYLGILRYKLDGISLCVGDNIDFTYGEAGYSKVFVFGITDEAVTKFKLHPLIANNKIEISNSKSFVTKLFQFPLK